MSDNPLLVAPRETVVELWPGDVERRVFDLETELNAAQEAAEAFDAEQSGTKRMSGKPENPHAVKADELAAAIDAAVAEVSPVRVVFRAPRARDVRALRDDHPPRKGNEDDAAIGVNPEGFYPALGAKCVVEPEVTGEQWAEFVADCSEFNWRKITAALDAMCATEVAVPKSSAVSALTQRRRLVSTLRDDSE